MGIRILGDDDEKRDVPETREYQRSVLDAGDKILPVVVVMGIILLIALFVAVKPVPVIPACPSVTIPACPIIACPNITIPACPSMSLSCGNINSTYNNINGTYNNITLTSIHIFNSTNFNQNRTILLNASTTYNQTVEFNTTALGLGELIAIRVNYQ
jgi:hypothetical protein